jgi:hypothetical protein
VNRDRCMTFDILTYIDSVSAAAFMVVVIVIVMPNHHSSSVPFSLLFSVIFFSSPNGMFLCKPVTVKQMRV